MKSQKNTGGNNQILAEVWEDIVEQGHALFPYNLYHRYPRRLYLCS